ncbi:hypothetical protein ABPG75_009229 [Micractinium tetrahymenae]
MALLVAAPALAPFAPVYSTRSTIHSRLVATVVQQRQQQRQRPKAAARQAAAAAAALGGSLAASPAALAAADHAAATAAADPQTAQLVADLALLDAQSAGLLSAILKPALSLTSLLMIVRIVMSWYPELDGKQMPWTIAYTPTEPILKATRKLVPPFNGLDVSPIVWVALLSFLSEILTGPQGILSLIQRGAKLL